MYEETYNGGDVMVLLPCSKRRYNETGMAIEVYGIAAIDKLKQVLWDGRYDENVDTFILSAKHGIIRVDKELKAYDEEITQEMLSGITEELGEFLKEREYDLFFNFTDGLYAKAVNEVGYKRESTWGFDTIMLTPATRTASISGIDVLDSVIRDEVEIDPASEAYW